MNEPYLTKSQAKEIKMFARSLRPQRLAFAIYDERTVQHGHKWSMKFKRISKGQQKKLIDYVKKFGVVAKPYISIPRAYPGASSDSSRCVIFHYIRSH